MARIYTILNQKGGVGKTTTTINLGAYLAYYGQRVLLVDIDPQANTTSCLGIDKNTVKSGTYQTIINGESVSSAVMHNPRLKISLLPSSPDLAGAEVELIEVLAREGRLKNALQAVQDRYDYILIDCPPSLGLLTINGMVAAQDGLLIPVQCEYLALEGISQLVSTIERVRQAVFPKLTIRGVILTMYDSRTNLAKDVVDEIRKHFPNEAMETVIPRSVRLAEAPSYGLPILSYHPSSPGAVAYDQLARELLKKDGVKLAV
ncbi:MAG: ParA family protein [Chloroflexi bacterium]|nr:ParA family protein [Chloroflexota bacterium]MBT3670971.1 ParA family protein [Chloroflexota bacterium]MBT4002305.1 ParA family protein [Chloroflexota bacterium]MBT4306315.1 ParA family protein [Chloroflexota bacterium]MBT4532804.1 ParA family protein [Chloroflexota bacterium]